LKKKFKRKVSLKCLFLDNGTVFYSSVSQLPDHGPVTGPGINYTGP